MNLGVFGAEIAERLADARCLIWVARAQGLLDLGVGRPAAALEHLLSAIEAVRHGSSAAVRCSTPVMPNATTAPHSTDPER